MFGDLKGNEEIARRPHLHIGNLLVELHLAPSISPGKTPLDALSSTHS